jgi:hypothetical protein
MAQDRISTLNPYVPGFLRSLGALEEIYWLYSQSGPRGFAYAMEIEGSTTIFSAISLSAIDGLVRYSQNGTCGIRENPIGETGVKMPTQIGSRLDAENY